MSEEDCGYRPPSHPRTGCKCDRCAAVRAKAQEKQREKLANDPEYRAQQNAAAAARRREKRANDPEWWAQRQAAKEARRREQRQALCDKVDAIQLTQEDVMNVIWESLK